jgi:hypothetical protein
MSVNVFMRHEDDFSQGNEMFGEGLNVSYKPSQIFSTRIRPPREMVQQVQKGEQRLGLVVKAPMTEWERMTQKIPGEDTANMNSGGSAIKYKEIRQGSFVDNKIAQAQTDAYIERHRLLKEKYDGGALTMTEAKIPKPSKIPTITIIQDQPAINIADPEYRQLEDLSFSEQQEVVGSSRFFKPVPDPVSLIDVPAGGYDFRDRMPPRMRQMTQQELLVELEKYGKTAGRSVSFAPPRTGLYGGDVSSQNQVALTRQANANNVFQNNLYNTSLAGSLASQQARIIANAKGAFKQTILPKP